METCGETQSRGVEKLLVFLKMIGILRMCGDVFSKGIKGKTEQKNLKIRFYFTEAPGPDRSVGAGSAKKDPKIMVENENKEKKTF
jgi:hypothetical protein